MVFEYKVETAIGDGLFTTQSRGCRSFKKDYTFCGFN